MSNININVSGSQTTWEVGGTEVAQKANKMKHMGLIQDTMEVGQGLRITFTYANDANTPYLWPPNPDANPNTPEFVRNPPTYNHLYGNSLSEHLNELIDQYGLSENQVKKLIFMHFNRKVPVDDTFLQGLLAELDGMVAEELAQELDLPSEKERFEQIRERNKQLGKSLGDIEEKLKKFVRDQADGPAKNTLLGFLKTISDAKGKFQDVQEEIEKGEIKTQAETIKAIQEGAQKYLSDLRKILDIVKQGTMWLPMEGKTDESGFTFSFKDYQKLHDQLGGGNMVDKIKGEIAHMEIYLTGGLVAGAGETEGIWVEFDIDSGDLLPPNTNNNRHLQLLSDAYSAIFEGKLGDYAKMNGLPLDSGTIAELRFAHFNPGIPPNPEIAQLLTGLQAEALQELGNDYYIPDGWSPPVLGGEAYNQEISSQYSEQVVANIKEYGTANGLTEKQIQSMIYLHYHPGVDVPDKAALHGPLTSIESKVLSDINARFGIPAGKYTPPPAALRQDALIEGDFIQSFHENLDNLGLSTEQLAQVRALAGNPSLVATADPETLSLFEQVWNQTIGEIKERYGLPVGWVPSGGYSTLVDYSPGLSANLRHASEVVANFRKEVDRMPGGEDKAVYLNVLKIVTQALANLKELVHIIQGIDASIGQKASRLEMETQLRKIEERASKMKEMEEQMKKMEQLDAMGPIGKVLKYIFMAIMMMIIVLFIAPLNPALAAVIIAVTIAMMIVSAADDIYAATTEGEGFIKAMMEAISDAITDALGDTPFAKFLSFMVQWYVIIAAAGITLNLPMITDIMFNKSTMWEDLFAAFGADEQTTMILKMVTQVVAMILEIIMSIALTAGIGAAGKVADVVGKGVATGAQVATQVASNTGKAIQSSNKVFKMVQEALKELTKLINKLKALLNKMTAGIQKLSANLGNKIQAVKEGSEAGAEAIVGKIQKGASITSAVTEGIQGFVQMGVAIKKMEIALEKGELEEFVALLEGMLKELRKFIDKIFNGLSDYTDWSASIGNQLKQMHASHSAVLTRMQTAG